MYLFEVSASAYSTYNIVFVSYVFKRPNTTIGQVFLHSSVVDVLVKAQIYLHNTYTYLLEYVHCTDWNISS